MSTLNNERIDMRACTDCSHYPACTKPACPYRHLHTRRPDAVCQSWLQRKCRNAACPYGHPSTPMASSVSKPHGHSSTPHHHPRHHSKPHHHPHPREHLALVPSNQQNSAMVRRDETPSGLDAMKAQLDALQAQVEAQKQDAAMADLKRQMKELKLKEKLRKEQEVQRELDRQAMELKLAGVRQVAEKASATPAQVIVTHPHGPYRTWHCYSCSTRWGESCPNHHRNSGCWVN